MVMESSRVTLTLAASVIRTVKTNVPAVVGVPEILPLAGTTQQLHAEEKSPSPGGNEAEPGARDQVYGVVPPEP